MAQQEEKYMQVCRSLIVLSGADVVYSRGHGYLIKSLGEEFMSLLIGDSGQDHDLSARLFMKQN